MNKELYQTIEGLKDTLVNIDSARKQVSDTVAAYSETQNKIQNYVDKLDGIENGLKELIALLQNNKVVIEQQASSAVANLQTSCDEITKKIQSGQEVTSRSFTEKLDSKLQEVGKVANVFGDSVKVVEALAVKIKEISTDVADVVKTLNALRGELGSSQKKQDSVLDSLKESASSVEESCAEHTGLLNDLKDEIERTRVDVGRQVLTNRIISIAILGLLLVLLFLHFRA